MDYFGPGSSFRRWLSRGRSVHTKRFLVPAVAVSFFILIILFSDVLHLARRSSSGDVDSPTSRFVSPGSGRRTPCDPSEDEDTHGERIAENLLPHNGNVHTVLRAAGASVNTRTRVSVPQTIWQTARSHNDTPPLGIDLFNSWTKHNQEFDHFFLDDEDAQEFVEAHYNQSVAEAFKAMPLGVMRADAIRYMLLYHYGGVYADMDTECRQPVEAWAPRGCHFAVALENDAHFCQWAFASVAGHGALAAVLDLVVRRMLAADFARMNATHEHFVHQITGPAVFTEGVLAFLRTGWAPGQLEELYAADAAKLRARGVCVLTAAELEESLANLYGSQREDLQSASWQSWTVERDAFLGVNRTESDAAAGDAPGA